jgi:hypothetical protein
LRALRELKKERESEKRKITRRSTQRRCILPHDFIMSIFHSSELEFNKLIVEFSDPFQHMRSRSGLVRKFGGKHCVIA